MESRKPSTRREFLADLGHAARTCIGAGMAIGTGTLGGSGCFPGVGGSWSYISDECADTDPVTPVSGPSPVVEVHREDSVLEVTDPATGSSRFEIQTGIVRLMLDAALVSLTDGAAAPWSVLLPEAGPTTRVGIKVNCLSQYLPTSVALVGALVDSLRSGLGLDADHVIIWDRRLDELTRSGFHDGELGARVMGTVTSTTDASGPGYTDAICGVVEGKAPRLSRILTELTDVTINVPVLKTHGVSGITAALKNVYGVINNPGDYHSTLARALPALCRLPPIRRHFRLAIIDALVAVTLGGTSDPTDTYPRRLLAAVDPVALDSYSLELANQLRADKNMGLPDVDPNVTRWLENAHALGLGALQYEPRRIRA